MSMQSILSASLSLNRIQTVQSIHSQNEGRINVLKAEIKLDNGNEKKEAEVEKLQEKSSLIMDTMMDQVNEAQEALNPSEEEKDASATETKKEPNTDKVELSHSPEAMEGTDGEVKAAAVPSGDAVYTAEGKTEKPVPSGKKVNTKA